MKPGDHFDFDVYLSFYSHSGFFSKGYGQGKEPVWSEKGLTYDYAAGNERHLNLTIPASEKLIYKNQTLNIHMQIKFKNPFY